MSSTRTGGITDRISGAGKVLIAILGVLAAALALATAYLGYKTSSVTSINETVEAESSALTDEVQALQGQVAELTQERDDLQRQLDAARDGDDPTPPATSAGAGEVRRQGELTMTTTSGGADLDALEIDAQWGRLTGDPQDYDGPRFFNPDAYAFDNARYAILGAGQVADYSTCSTVTAWINRPSDPDDLVPGTHICSVTDENRFAGLVVKNRTADSVTFDVTTWENDS